MDEVCFPTCNLQSSGYSNPKAFRPACEDETDQSRCEAHPYSQFRAHRNRKESIVKSAILSFLFLPVVLFLTACNPSSVHEDVVISDDCMKLKWKAPSQDSGEWKDKALIYNTFFLAEAQIYPWVFQTWERRYQEFDYNPLHVFNIYNPKLPLYGCRWNVLLNPKDPEFDCEKSRLDVPQTPVSPKEMKLVYLFMRFPSAEWPHPAYTIPDRSTEFAFLLTNYDEMSGKDCVSLEHLSFKKMDEIVKDQPLYDLILFAFTHPQYYNMWYRKPVFTEENERYSYRDEQKEKAVKGAYRYAEELHTLYEKQPGSVKKEFPELNWKPKPDPVASAAIQINVISIDSGSTSGKVSSRTIKARDLEEEFSRILQEQSRENVSKQQEGAKE